MVALLQLIFDDDRPTTLSSATRSMLNELAVCSRSKLTRYQIERIVEDIDVLLQPLREVVSFMLPDFSKGNSLQPCQSGLALLVAKRLTMSHGVG